MTLMTGLSYHFISKIDKISIHFDQSTLTSCHLAQTLSTMTSIPELVITLHKSGSQWVWWLWWQDYHTTSYQKSTKFRSIWINLLWPLVISHNHCQQLSHCLRWLSSHMDLMLDMCDDSDDRTIIPIHIENVQKFDQFRSIYTDLSSSRTNTVNNDVTTWDNYSTQSWLF